jgi:hypothetical protein
MGHEIDFDDDKPSPEAIDAELGRALQGGGGGAPQGAQAGRLGDFFGGLGDAARQALDNLPPEARQAIVRFVLSRVGL